MDCRLNNCESKKEDKVLHVLSMSSAGRPQGESAKRQAERRDHQSKMRVQEERSKLRQRDPDYYARVYGDQGMAVASLETAINLA